jgi:hypothetical protein
MVIPHQGSAPIDNNSSGSISSGNNTQRAVATGNKSKKPISPSIWKNKTFLIATIMTILGLLAAVVYFVLPYLASMKANELARIANELSQLESCYSYPVRSPSNIMVMQTDIEQNDAFLQSLDICKSAREEGDVDSAISQRSNSLVPGWSGRFSWLRGLEVLWNKIYRFPGALLGWFLPGDDDRVSLHRYWFWTVIPPMLPHTVVRMLNEGHADLNARVYYRPPAIFFFVVSIPCVSVFYLSFPGVLGGI